MILIFICYFGASLAKRDSGTNLRDTCVADLLASWTLTVELVRGLDGKRRQLHETYRGNKRQAQDRLAESIASVKDGYSIRPERITVQQFMAD